MKIISTAVVLYPLSLLVTSISVFANANEEKNKACIINTATNQEYCLSVGQRSDYSLPQSVYGKEVYVHAPQGTKVLLSDFNNLSYNRIGEFVGTNETSQLNGVKAWSGQTLDFSRPKSMRVVESGVPLGCIVSLSSSKEYCLPAGKRSDYMLPNWIYGEEVYVNASPGTKVLLSDWDNLSYDRIGEFVGTVETRKLNNVRAWSGEILDFSHPRSMRVVSSDEALGCIISIDSNKQYCLPAGQRSEYSLPDWIIGETVYVQADPRVKVMLSDWDNLSYDRIAEFTGTVLPEELANIKAKNGEMLDFSQPKSMRVIKIN